MPPPLTPEERAAVLERNRRLRETERSFRLSLRQTGGRTENIERVRASMREQRLRHCPVLAADVSDENRIEPGVAFSHAWLTGQIVEAFRNAGVTPSVEPSIVASRLLKSHDLELCIDLAAFTPEHANLHRIYAHIETLGIALPLSVMGSLARRIFLVIANQKATHVNGKSDMEFCVECGEMFARGDKCGCPG